VIIGDIERISSNGKHILQATITWEVAAFEPDTYYFSVDEQYGELLGNPADAFLCGSILPAFIHGEERVEVDGDVCPSLVDNLQEALFWISTWYPEYRRTEPIRVDAGFRSQIKKEEGAALFYSGGVDAAFSLAHNRDTIPIDHPAAVSRLVLVHGFDICGKRAEKDKPSSLEAFRRAEEQAMIAANGYSADLITLSTNIRHLDDRSGIWGHVYIGGAISAGAHALGGGGDLFYVSAEGSNIPTSGHLPFFGSHPVLDHCYSSYGVRIKHYLANYDSRLKRIEALKSHPILLDSLRVCFNPPKDKLNCQRCEKCVRTRLQLELLGLINQCRALDECVTAQELSEIAITSDVGLAMYEEIHQLMLSKAHPLSKHVKTIIENYKAYKKWKEGKTWKRRLVNLIKPGLKR